ncbi:DUF2326 domain-containing protein [Roseivirga sp.]|uniref:DUF2326 domain-containing protein n=1 Tax=Roseivirga sp. TaxID=1964215 RepID=UPI002356CE90|nr:DUF2326 domain-containing protein [Roseivirga sp.]
MSKDSHNLGKSTLISVIDFLLLKTLDKSHIFKQYEGKFRDHILFLEVLLNSGEYMTIKRPVSNSTKISFKIHEHKNQNFINEKKWDEPALPIKKAKEYLEEKVNFDVIPNWPFRKSVTYFLRSQEDYRDVFQLAKFSAGKDVDWKPFLFDLLGFNGDFLRDKYELESAKDKQKDLIKEFKDKLSVNPEELDKIRGAIELKKDERNELQEEIDNFNFYQKERRLNKDLVENIESQIAELNSREYDLQYELDQINSALKTESIQRFDDVRTIWEEAKVVFQDAIIKEYEQLEEFNRKITEERTEYLNERFKELSEGLGKVRESLKKLDVKRSEILSVLSDRDSFRKFKKYQIDISKAEAELARLEEQLKNIDRIDVFNKAIKEIEDKVDDIKNDIKLQIESSDNIVYPEIRKNFRNIIKYIVNNPAILYIVTNSNGNVEYKAEIQSEDEIEITADGKGFSYKKFLCMAFDLAVLMTYHKKSFFRFVYHDGALESLDNRKKVNFIKKVREVCKKNGLQYIFTSIEDHLPIGVQFSDDEIAVEFDDSGDEGKLFGMSF